MSEAHWRVRRRASVPHVLVVGGEDVHRRIDLMQALGDRFRFAALGSGGSPTSPARPPWSPSIGVIAQATAAQYGRLLQASGGSIGPVATPTVEVHTRSGGSASA